jgi:hypothetical protein
MASMDFTPTGWAAQYDPAESKNNVAWRPVERWSADEKALVVHERHGCLVNASDLQGFKGLVRANRVVGIVSAEPGWQLKLWEDDKDDNTAYQVPIAAWVVDAGGALIPVPHTSDAYLETSLNQRSEIVAP